MTTLKDWEISAGPICSECGQESLRILDGKCPECHYSEVDKDQLRKQVLNGKKLTRANMDMIWTQAHQGFLTKLEGKAKELGLTFDTRLDLRGWVFRRVDLGSCCIVDPTQECPCSDPVSRGCPLLHR